MSSRSLALAGAVAVAITAACSTIVVELGEGDATPGDGVAGDAPSDQEPAVACHCRKICRLPGDCTTPPADCVASHCSLGSAVCSLASPCGAAGDCLVDGTQTACPN